MNQVQLWLTQWTALVFLSSWILVAAPAPSPLAYFAVVASLDLLSPDPNLVSQAALTLLAISCFFGMAAYIRPKFFIIFLKYSAVAASVATLVSAHPQNGVLNFLNPSQTGVFIALALPFVGGNLIYLLLCYAAILVIHASTPLILLFVMRIYLRRWKVLYDLPLIALYLRLAPHWHGLLDSNTRTQYWQIAFDFICKQPLARQLLGQGAGSFAVMFPAIQLSRRPDLGLAYYLHNDWLQLFFEYGAIGFAVAAAYFVFLLKTPKPRALQAGVIAYGLAMLTTPVLHFPLTCLVGVTLVLSSQPRTKQAKI